MLVHNLLVLSLSIVLKARLLYLTYVALVKRTGTLGVGMIDQQRTLPNAAVTVGLVNTPRVLVALIA